MMMIPKEERHKGAQREAEMGHRNGGKLIAQASYGAQLDSDNGERIQMQCIHFTYTSHTSLPLHFYNYVIILVL